jgi:two-component system response regulator YesN
MLRVLLVDDNIKAIEGLRRHIPWQETDCICLGTALNGQEALDLCRQLPPDIVITDVRMPMMDGLELCRRLREEFTGIHLIVLSAYDEFDYARNALAFGVENYILKPIDEQKIQELAKILRRIADTAQNYSSALASYYNSSIVSELGSAILGGSAEEIQRLVRAALSSQPADAQSARDVATHLLAALFQQAANIGLPGRIAGHSLVESLTELQAIHSSQAMIAYVSQSYLAVFSVLKAHQNQNFRKTVEAVKAFIENHYSDPEITTYSIARQFHISQSYLCHIYKSIEKNSINNVITQLRIERAAGLLHTGDLSINEISRMVGYSDAHYFTRVFKKIKGLSPSDFKKITQQNGTSSTV